MSWRCYQFQWIYEINYTIFFRIALLLLGQSSDCPSTSAVILKNIYDITLYPTWVFDLPLSFSSASLALGQLCVCHSGIEMILKDMHDIVVYITTIKANYMHISWDVLHILGCNCASIKKYILSGLTQQIPLLMQHEIKALACAWTLLEWRYQRFLTHDILSHWNGNIVILLKFVQQTM